MKICYLTYGIDSTSGYGRFTSDLVNGVQKLGHETLILNEKKNSMGGITVLKRGGLFRIGVSACKSLKYIKNCDVIHALDGYPYGIIGNLANTFHKKKFVLTGLGTYAVDPLYQKKIGFLMKHAYKHADIITTPSIFTKEEILKKILNKNIFVIHPGIDLKKYSHPHSDTQEQFILSVGALKKRKGYHISIPAFALSKKEFPDLKYKIVGSQLDTNYFNHLKKLIKKYKIENDVEFLQEITQEQLTDLYCRAQIFILVSVNYQHNFEGFGLVFLEAASCGTPSIGTTDNGITDAIYPEKSGILVPQNKIENTHKAIVNMLSNKDKWYTMSKNCVLWANEHDLSRSILKYVNIYEKLLQKNL